MGKIDFDTKVVKTIAWILFFVYLVLLIKVILLKYPMEMIEETIRLNDMVNFKKRICHSNFIPMKTIRLYLNNNVCMRIRCENIIGNIIAFMPLGVMWPFIINKMNKLINIISIGLLLSLAFESIQLITGIGEFDVDDLILNVLGTILGFVIFRFMEKLLIKMEIL